MRCGQKPGWKGSTLTTVLLKDVRDMNGNIVADHLWFNLTKGFGSLVLREGITIFFDARVTLYYKGYKGYREEVAIEKPVEMDFKLSRPTKFRVQEKQTEKEAPVLYLPPMSGGIFKGK